MQVKLRYLLFIKKCRSRNNIYIYILITIKLQYYTNIIIVIIIFKIINIFIFLISTIVSIANVNSFFYKIATNELPSVNKKRKIRDQLECIFFQRYFFETNSRNGKSTRTFPPEKTTRCKKCIQEHFPAMKNFLRQSRKYERKTIHVNSFRVI